MNIKGYSWPTAILAASILSAQASAQECEKSSVLRPTPFMGNNGEIFTLADNSVWEVKNEHEYLYEYYPSVIICKNAGKLIIGTKSLNVQLVAGSKTRARVPGGSTGQAGAWEVFEETNLQGSISGTVKSGSIFKTTSGNVYEVVGLTLQLVLELQPSAMVLRSGDVYKLIVEGFDEPLICRKVNDSPQAGSTAASRGGATAIQSVIETQTDGEFSGWSGETVVKLANGQIWQQTEYFYVYHYAYRPKVIVYLSGGTYKMKVDGVDKAVGVRLLR